MDFKSTFRSSPKLIIFILSVLITIGVESMLEYLVEDILATHGLSNLTVPIAVSIGLLVNIALLLNFDLLAKVPKLFEIQNQLEKEIESNNALLLAFQKEETELKDTYLEIKQRNVFLRDFAVKLISSYLHGFRNVDNGIELSGEYWALKTYVEFWNQLILLQKERNQNNGKNVIVRCTHSNDIRIWIEYDRAYQDFSYDLYRNQREFIKEGGQIIRVFIGEDDKPNNDYEKVMRKMEKIKIETKYLSQKEAIERSFDFLYMPDEEVNMKWISGSRGKRLAKCIIEDKIDNEVRATWNSLWDKLIEKGDPIKSIPKGREHDKRNGE